MPGQNTGRVASSLGRWSFAQGALREIPNRNELSERKLTEIVNDKLAKKLRELGKKKIGRRTVMRAKRLLDALDL